MRIGVVATTLSRAAGGLFNSVRYSSLALAEAGHDVRVFGLQDGQTDEDLKAWAPLKPTVLPRVGPHNLGYSPGLAKALISSDLDVVHQHGIWQGISHSVSKWRRQTGGPVVIAPRGMLDPWAVKRSRPKKLITGLLFETDNLRHAAAMHALNMQEAEAFRSYGLTQQIEIIPNGTHLPDLAQTWAKPEWVKPQKKVLLFLGRLHPKKGLLPLLQGWVALKASQPALAEQWQLAIAGWDDGGHEAELHRFVKDASLEDSVIFTGPLFGEDKAAAFAHSNAFILPSHSEGLPMSVLEAWSYGLPVFMTEACNIPDGFKAKAAVEIRPDAASIKQVLAQSLNDQTRLTEMGQAGASLVKTQYEWSAIATQQADLYQSLLS